MWRLLHNKGIKAKDWKGILSCCPGVIVKAKAGALCSGCCTTKDKESEGSCGLSEFCNRDTSKERMAGLWGTKTAKGH